MALQDLIRTANQQGLLLGDWPAWHRYRDSHARTSHTCQAKIAQEVAAVSPGCLSKAEFLRDEL
jgi:hypothetical protein